MSVKVMARMKGLWRYPLLVIVLPVVCAVVLQFCSMVFSVCGHYFNGRYIDRQCLMFREQNEHLRGQGLSPVSSNNVQDVRLSAQKIFARNGCTLQRERGARCGSEKVRYMCEKSVEYLIAGAYANVSRCVAELLSLRPPVLIDAVTLEPRLQGGGVQMSCTLRYLEEVR